MSETATVDAAGKVEAVKPDLEPEEFDGKIESAFGKPLADYNKGISVIPYKATFERINVNSAIPPKEMPDDADILDMANNKRKANARSKEIARLLELHGIKKPTMEEDVELQVKSMVVGMVASKRYTQEQAEKVARRMLGLVPDEEPATT